LQKGVEKESHENKKGDAEAPPFFGKKNSRAFVRAAF